MPMPKYSGSFVWADSQETEFASTGPNQANFRCSGGVMFTDGTGHTVAWTPGFASWTFSSDRNLKERIESIDSREILERLSRLPLSEWSYKGFAERHVGPMAQDFHALFQLNESDTMLNDADLHGVALAAIQGLNGKLDETVNNRDARIATLEGEVAELKALVNSLLQRSAERDLER